jgi:hypothetical protein
MRPPKSHRPGSTTFKERVEIAQAIVTIVAVFVGGLWTYDIFIKERREYPHANIELKITHLTLSDRSNLLRVGLNLTNTGKSLMTIEQSIIRVQQILPQLPCSKGVPCAADELSEATANVVRKDDHFTWPLIAERTVTFTPSAQLEPGEKQNFDFEFVTPSDVKAVRIYTFFRNDRVSKKGKEIGWAASSYYDFPADSRGGAK